MSIDYDFVCKRCKVKTDAGNSNFFESSIPFIEKHMPCTGDFTTYTYDEDYAAGWPENRDDEQQRIQQEREAYEKTDHYKIERLSSLISHQDEKIKNIFQTLRSISASLEHLHILHKDKIQEELENRLK